MEGPVCDPGVFIAGKLSFHRNEWGSTSNTVSSYKTYIDRCIPNSFFIYTPPPDVKAPSLCGMKFSVFIQILNSDEKLI